MFFVILNKFKTLIMEEKKKNYDKNRIRVNASYTEEEYKLLKVDADKYGISVTQLVKKRSLKKEKHLLKEPKINIQTRADINKIGSNINQIARRVNMDPNFNDNLISFELKKIVEILREMLNKIK